MLTDEDIQKIIEAQKGVFTTKEDLAKLLTLEEFDQSQEEVKQEIFGLLESVQALTISVDKLTKVVEDLHEEFIAITAQVDRHEKWFHQIADKLGIKLEY